jgi:hypothetical protein
MALLVFMGLAIIAAIVVPFVVPKSRKSWAIKGGSWVGCAVLFFFCFFQTSFVIVGDMEVGHLKRIYWGSEMQPGRIIAMPWEKGPQARVLTAGFHFLPLIRVTHDLEMLDVVNVPEGKYGFLVAKDGKSMPDGQYIADAWPTADEMSNALNFMGYVTDKSKYKSPRGTKGPQLTVIKPGTYRLNRYLFEVSAGLATDIPIGHVGVIKSNVGPKYTGDPILPAGVEDTNLSVPIVPKGSRGVWDTVLEPDRYYLNTKAYDVTIIPTQVQTWKYLGGYTRRIIDLKLDNEGKIEQSVRSEVVPFDPKISADKAVLLRVENWDVFQDLRAQVQVTPQNAPFVVAAAGGLKQIEDKIFTPTLRSVLRNEVARNVEDTREIWDEVEKKTVEETYWRPRKVLDLLYKREATEKAVEDKLIPEGAKVGLTVMEIRFGDPVVPPELLIPGKRKQLAESLIATYKQEKIAQDERIKTQQAWAEAEQQPRLVKSQIGITVAENNAKAREKEGVGEEKFMKALARGQKAQADVLGKEAALELAVIEKVLAAAQANPSLVKYPNILVINGSDGMGSLEGAAAILGKSNLTFGLTPKRKADDSVNQ